MKRSQIDALIGEAIELFESHGFRLPPFALWTPAQWAAMGSEADGIREAGLGWDLTDFGTGPFDRMGLLLFTVRNGRVNDPDGKTYCEKIMAVQPGQVTPMHFHHAKTEDIINRGGGNLVCRCYWATESDRLDESTVVTVGCDGVRRQMPPGADLVLRPGESVTLAPRLYHSFWGQPGMPAVVVGEVSTVNDDRMDNRFLDPVGRFPAIEEDAAAMYLLCNEYPPAR